MKYRNEIEKLAKDDPDLGIKLLGPLTGISTGKKTNDDVYDCFTVNVISEWATGICGSACRCYKWAGLEEMIFFGIKSSFTQSKAAKTGFQLNPYAMNDNLFDAVEKSIIPTADEFFDTYGIKHKIGGSKRRYFYWELRGDCIPVKDIVGKLIPEFIKIIKGK